MLTAFFSAKKVEAKADRPAKKQKIYTDVDTIIPRFSFTKVILITVTKNAYIDYKHRRI